MVPRCKSLSPNRLKWKENGVSLGTREWGCTLPHFRCCPQQHDFCEFELCMYIFWASQWDYVTHHIGDQRRLRRACVYWLCKWVWRMSLRRTKSTIISWDGSFHHYLRNEDRTISPPVPPLVRAPDKQDGTPAGRYHTELSPLLVDTLHSSLGDQSEI